MVPKTRYLCDIRVVVLQAAFVADTFWGVLLEPACKLNVSNVKTKINVLK